MALLVARRENREKLAYEGYVPDLGDRLPARMKVAALAEGDEFLDDRAQILGFRQRRDDLLMLDERLAEFMNIALRCSWVRPKRRLACP